MTSDLSEYISTDDVAGEIEKSNHIETLDDECPANMCISDEWPTNAAILSTEDSQHGQIPPGIEH